MNPEIATILDNGEYGQRPMTDQEYAAYLALIKDQQLHTQEDTPE